MMNIPTPFGNATILGGLPGSGGQTYEQQPHASGNDIEAANKVLDNVDAHQEPVNTSIGNPGIRASNPSDPGLMTPGMQVATAGMTGEVNMANADNRERAKKVYSFYRGRGWDDLHAKAITGKLAQESFYKGIYFNPNAEGDRNMVDKEGNPLPSSIGISQVRNERATALKQYAKRIYNSDWNYLTAQLDYFDNELKHGVEVEEVVNGRKVMVQKRDDLVRVGKTFADTRDLDEALGTLAKFQGSINDVEHSKKRLRELGLL